MTSTIQIKTNKIDQLVNKEIYIAKMNILELQDIIRYTNRKSNDLYYSEQEEGNVSEEYRYYQRIKSSDRAYQIKLFFLKHIYNKYHYEKKRISPLGTFPSSIILAFNSFDGNSIEEYNTYLKTDENPDTIYIDKAENIIIPRTNKGLIVDGQHRIAGLQLLWDEARNGNIVFKKANARDYYAQKDAIPRPYLIDQILNFNFIISVLSDFDLYEQSEIFATVNFNQQRVNKSFYYDIFGTVNSGKTIEKLLHDITSNLNYKEDSPLFHKIKMLGSGPGYFSQAFFVDALVPHFKSGTFQFVYNDFQNGGDIYRQFPDFLKAYFTGIFNVFKFHLPIESEKKYKSVLLKTTGMGALILLLPVIFNYIKNSKKLFSSKDVLDINKQELTSLIEDKFSELNEKGESFFGEEGNFSKGSGRGLQNKLFSELKIDLAINITPVDVEEPMI